MKTVYFLGEYTFETRPAALCRGLKTVPSSPKQLELLHALVRAEGRPLKKDQLLREVWPGVTVDGHTLVQTVYLLRLTLGKLPDGRDYIETVPRYGYRLASGILVVDQISSNRSMFFKHPFLQFWRRLTPFFKTPTQTTESQVRTRSSGEASTSPS